MRRAVVLALSLGVVAADAAVAQQRELKSPRSQAATRSAPAPEATALAVGTQPLHFEENVGQADPRVEYLSRARGYTIFLAANEALMRLTPSRPRDKQQAQVDSEGQLGRETDVLRMRLVGANRTARIDGIEPLPAKIYYVRGDERGPLTGSATFAKVKNEAVYPGIDLVYYGNERRLEFDFVVAPHADPHQIRLEFSGADAVVLEKSGDLSLRLIGQEIRLRKPLIYQEIRGQHHEVAGGFRREGASSVRFEVGSYDPSFPLVIDPVIDFATYLGTSGTEVLGAVAVNAANEIYVAGGTANPLSFPRRTTFGPSASSEEPFRCFVSKFDPNGAKLAYSVVYLDRAECSSLAMDSSGHVYTFTRSIVSPSAIRAIVEINGGPSITEISVPWVSAARGFSDFRVSADGTRFYIVGVCALEDLWPLVNGFEVLPGPGFCREAPLSSQNNRPLLVVVDNVGNLIYGTFLGGSGDSPGTGSAPVGGPSSLAVDGSGKVYIVGHTASPDFPLTANGQQQLCADLPANKPCSDGYLTVIDSTRSGAASLEYSSFIGGEDLDFPTSVALDGPNRVVLTTASRSKNFPGAPGTGGVFITKYSLASCGSPCIETTRQVPGFVPPESLASPRPQMTRFRNGRIGVMSQADDTLPLQAELFSVAPPPGFTKAAVTVLTPDLALTDFASYLDDTPSGQVQFPRLTTDTAENLYVALITVEDNRATTLVFQDHPAGSGDVLLFKLSSVFPNAGNYAPVFDLGPDLTLAPTSPAGLPGFQLECFTFGTLCIDPDGDAMTLTWTGSLGTFVGEFFRVDLPIGSHTITLIADDGRGGVTTDTVIVTVLSTNTPAGTNVSVTLTDDSFLAQINSVPNPVTVTFSNVTNPGIVSLRTRVDQNPPVANPTGLQIGSPPMYYEVLANGALAFTGDVRFCVSTRGMSFANPGAIQLHRLVSNTWIALTSQSSSNTQICGDAPALGTFAILYPEIPETQLATIAGTGFAPGELDGDPNGGPDSRDNYNEGGPATQAAFVPGGPGAVDRARGYLYFTASEYQPSGGGSSISKGVLYRLNLNTGILDRLAGNRVYPFLTDGPGGNPADDPIDGALALDYPLVEPGGVALDPAGNVYFTERISNGSHQFCGILKYDVTTLRITRVAGLPPFPGGCGFSGDGGPARSAGVGNGRLDALAADSAGNLYVLDTLYDSTSGSYSPLRIRRVDAVTGIISTVVGNGTQGAPVPGAEATQSPLGLVAGFVLDRENHLLFLDGFQLMRVAPGPDNVVNGGPGETMTQLTCCLNSAAGYSDFSGDGQAIGQVFALSSLSSIAVDGSLLINQFHRARRIERGTDSVVSGAPDEIIHTIAGFEYDTQDPAFGGGSGVAFYNGDRFATNSSLGLNGVYDDPQGRILLIERSFGRIRSFGLPRFLSVPDLTASKSIVTHLTPGPLEVLAPALDVNNGDTVRFRLTASNVGNAPTSGPIVLSDRLASGLTYTGGDARCSAAAQVVTCVLPGPLLPGQSQSVDVLAQLGLNVAPLGQQVSIANEVSVSTAGDTNSSNGLSSQVVLTVNAPISNLMAEKLLVLSGSTYFQGTANNGDVLRFRLRAFNQGPAATIGPVTFTDTLPAQLTFIAAGSDPRCSAAGQIVSCIVTGPIGVNQSESPEINAQVGAGAAGAGQSIQTGNVLVVSVANDSDTIDDGAVLPLTINGPVPPNVMAIKSFAVSGSTQSSLTVTNGNAVRYRLTAFNDGSGPTTGMITFSDVLDPALTFVAAGSDSRCAGVGQVVTCQSPGQLAPGQSVSFDFNVLVGSNVAGIGQSVLVANLATVATQHDTDSVDDASGVVLTVEWRDTIPPVVTAPASIVVAAILPSGTHGNNPNLPESLAVAGFLNGSRAIDDFDLSPVRRPEQTVDCTSPSVVTNPLVNAGTVFPVGTTCVRFTWIDTAGNTGTAVSSITVNPPIGGHVFGPGVPVTATDANNVPQPVTVNFLGSTGGGGLVQANPIVPPPATPGFQILGVAYDITTTVPYTPPIEVCFLGQFQAGDVIYHNGVPVPTTVSAGMACATVSSLSPFMVLRGLDTVPPVLTLPADITAEATGAAGTVVNFFTIAVDAVDGLRSVTCVPASGATFGLGTTTVSCTASDVAGNTATGSFRVMVQDTTPPTSVLDVAPHLIAGQALTLSAARSSDTGGGVARYRWQIPDAGIDVETTTPTYTLAAPTGLTAGPHVVTLTVIDSSGNLSSSVNATVTVIAQQTVVPVLAGMSPGSIQAIDTGPDDQNDPHVHKNLMAYTHRSNDEFFNPTSTVRYFDFSTGTGAAITQASGDMDFLPDVNQNRILFNRRTSSGDYGIFLFDLAAASVIEIDPRPATTRFVPALGAGTIAYQDALSNNGDIVSYDLTTGLSSVVDARPSADTPSAVSPDGSVVVWQSENGVTQFDIYMAARVQGGWSVTPVAATPANEGSPDTDGTWIVYYRAGVDGWASVFYRAVAGGPEYRIAGFFHALDPAISDGVISFSAQMTAAHPYDLFVYDIASNHLYQVTSSAEGDHLNDISVLDNGDVRVVWAAGESPTNDVHHNVYATTFSIGTPTTLAVAPASGVAGESIRLSATLTANGNPVDNAQLEFQIDGDPAVAVVRTGPDGVATVGGPLRVNPGTYPDGIRVRFAGDPTRRLRPASGSATLAVGRAPTTLALTINPDLAALSERVTITATISSSFGSPAGDVSFTARVGTTATPLRTVLLDANGTATFGHSMLPVGAQHVICAEYAGSAIHRGSLVCSTITITKAPTQTIVTSSRNPSLTTGPPIFTATIQGTPFVQPTGKVEFFADGTLLCRSTIFVRFVAATASCGGAPLTPGNHLITATYSGDANFEPSSSATLTQAVQPGSYFALDLGFEGEAVALSPNGWVTGHSELKAAVATTNTSTAFVHDGSTLGVVQPIPSLGGTKTVAVGVDNFGRVGGWSTTATGATQLFVFFNSLTFGSSNPFGGVNSTVSAMNSAGAIVGLAETSSGTHAFLAVPPWPSLLYQMYDLGTLPGGANSAAFAISELGHIVGAATVPGSSSVPHAAMFGDATAVDLGTLGGLRSGATAVNIAGESAGFSDVSGGDRHAFIYRDGAMQDIGASLGSPASIATTINDAAQVVGTYEDTSTGTSRAFLYSIDTTTDLGPATSVVLNNTGVVVQTASNQTTSQIVVRTGGSVLTSGSSSGGFEFTTRQVPAMAMNATAINDEGRIAGSIMGFSGRPRATVWIPVPLASLVVDAVSAQAGSTVLLSARLTSQGVAIENKSILFRINGAEVGTGSTDADGRATFTAIVPAGAQGIYPDGIQASFAGDETLGFAFGTAQLTVEPPPPPDVWIAKSIVDQGSLCGSECPEIRASNGDEVRFRLVMTLDAWGGPLTGPITISDTLPAGLVPTRAFGTSLTLGFACGTSGQQVTCTLLGWQAMNPGDQTGVEIVAQVGPNVVGFNAVPLINLATVATPNDRNPNNNTSTAVVLVVGPPDASIEKSIFIWPSCQRGCRDITVSNGEEVEFVIDVQTEDLPLAGPLTLTDSFPIGLVPIRTNGGDFNCVFSGQVATCTLPVLPRRADTVTARIVARVGDTVAGLNQTMTLTNIATVAMPNDANSANNTSQPVAVHVQGPRAGAPTGLGTNVPVQPTDANNVPQPITLTFAGVTQAGLTTAVPIVPPPPAPAGFQFRGVAYDISTTAEVTPPIEVCFIGAGFSLADRIWHAGMVLPDAVHTVLTSTRICARVSSLSPFGVVTPLNHTPTADAGTYPPFEATSPDGAAVTLTGTGNDPDGDPLAFTWTEGGVTLGTGPSITRTLAIGAHEITLTVDDNRGGTATAIAHVVVRDTIAPAITITAPANGGTYTLNQAVASAYNCADTASGVATCAGPVASGGQVDTATVGVVTFTVTSTDRAGNVATATSTYRVAYRVCLLYDETKAKKSGSTVPIRLQLCDVDGANYSSPDIALHARGVALLATGDTGPAEDAGNANPDQAFRYDPALAGYIFNLKTTGYSMGTYGLTFTVGNDPTIRVAQFRVR